MLPPQRGSFRAPPIFFFKPVQDRIEFDQVLLPLGLTSVTRRIALRLEREYYLTIMKI
jgi:hypothetical protein